MEVDVSDSSTAGSLTDRLGAGPRTKHIDTRYIWVQERVQDGYLSITKESTLRNCADTGTKPASSQLLQQHLFPNLVWCFFDHGPHTPLPNT